jgi:trimethylamine--corrinoid protein Co-methyltransferase
MQGLQYFTQAQLDEVHAATLQILDKVGVVFTYAPARKLLGQAGCRIDGQRVFLPPKLVEAQVCKAPDTIVLCGRDTDQNAIIGGEETVYGPCYGPPNVVSLDQGRHASTLEDFVNFVKLCHHSANLDMVGGVMVEPNDLPVAQRTAEMVYASLKYSTKPFMGGVAGAQAARQCIDMAARVFGGESALAQNPPFVSLLGATPPLAWDDLSLSAMTEYVNVGLPVLCNTFHIAGVSAPVTLEGMLVIQNAEILAAIVYAQLLREGTPVIYSASSTCGNFRSGTATSGAPEMGVLTVATVQLARYYNVPCRSGGAVTDAKALDAQAGYESMMNLLMSTLAQTPLVLMAAGFIENYMAASYEKFVIDDDLIGMCRRIRRDARTTPERLALDVIKDASKQGEFITHSHTFQHFKQELYAPMLEERWPYAKWVANGAETIELKANRRWKQALVEYKAPDWPKSVQKDLRRYIDNIG